MKEDFCEIRYNMKNKKWNCIIETALIKDYFECMSINKCKKYIFKKIIDEKIDIYIYDKRNNLVERRKIK